MHESSHGASATVIGANGFIGRALVDALADDGVEVVRIGRGDLDHTATLRRVAASRTIFWTASTINPAIAAAHPERVESDRAALLGLLDSMGSMGSTARVVFLSSGGTVYVGGEPPFDESSPTSPTAAYGAAKLAMERDLRSARAGTLSLRLSNVYGPGQRPAPGQGVISHWLEALANGEAIHVFGSLESLRDYLYIDDLVEALLAAHRLPGPFPEVLNLGSGRGAALGEVLRLVESVTASVGPEIVIEESRSFDLSASWLDCREAERVLGWRAGTPLADGIANMWSWRRSAAVRR